jgi:type VI secretion system protein ImpF
MAGRLNPTLLDKLVADLPLSGLREDEGAASGKETGRGDLRYYSFANLDKFTEEALQTNIRRELAWLLNTTNLESAVKLASYPQVKTSVLNYGVADLSGKAQSRSAVVARASKIREAVAAFEPRLDPSRLAVEISAKSERENAVTYTITGDITSAVQSIRVQYLTDIEVDTGAANVRE